MDTRGGEPRDMLDRAEEFGRLAADLPPGSKLRVHLLRAARIYRATAYSRQRMPASAGTARAPLGRNY
jgi:hypothetical protein